LSQRFVVLSGEERIIYDQDIGAAEDEDARHRRKGARDK
jgi:FdhD protein